MTAPVEACWACAHPDGTVQAGQNLPLCSNHWARWVIRFGSGRGPIPPCSAHLLKETP